MTTPTDALHSANARSLGHCEQRLEQALDALRETRGIISRLVAIADDAQADDDNLWLLSDSNLIEGSRTVLLHVQLVLSLNAAKKPRMET